MLRLAAAALGVLVVAVWALAVAYGAPAWITWGNFTLGVIALASLGPLRTSDVAGFATWPLVAMVLLAMWLFGLRVASVYAWLDFLLGLGFIALTGAWLAEAAGYRPRRRHMRPAREAYRT